uniref:Small integral membrane protein 22 n=1 Tax=Anabas testudineus TaxID=64144 RepID=A0A3Q1J8F9_ANATE
MAVSTLQEAKYKLLQSKQFFQSDWDIASFAVFFIFIGMVGLLLILVLIRCCCCCCCDDDTVNTHARKEKKE